MRQVEYVPHLQQPIDLTDPWNRASPLSALRSAWLAQSAKGRLRYGRSMNTRLRAG
jgi:hypothetical protein